MPMDYRTAARGFETHLDLLAESIQQQKAWARDFAHFWPGVAASQLYDEEREPLTRMRRFREGGKDVEGMRAASDKVGRLKSTRRTFSGAIEAYLKTDPRTRLRSSTPSSRAACPRLFRPNDRLTKTLERVRAQGLEGIVIFSTGGISSLPRLWKAVEEFFGR